MNKITSKEFKKMTGCKPEQDDLERCNCKKAGEFGHYGCGICEKCNKPRWLCGHLKIIKTE